MPSTHTDRPNVAIIEPVGGHGGMDYYDFGLAEGLHAAGCSAVVYTCDETPPPASDQLVCCLTFRGIYGPRSRVARGLRYAQGLARSLYDAKRRHCQIVHLHFFHAGLLELGSALAARACGFKLVITVHDVESFSGQGSSRSARWVFGLAHQLIAHNGVSSSELVAKVGISRGLIQEIPHGNYMRQAELAPSKDIARDRLGITRDKKVVLFFGQIKKVKGLDLLLSAFGKVRAQHPEALLVIAGKVWKDDFSNYEEVIEREGLSDCVRTDIRYITDSDALLYYAASDVVVLPYRKIYQSGVLLMAMSFNRLVLVSDLPGMTEIVEDGKNGLVFATGDVADLAGKLSQAILISDQSELAEQGLRLMTTRHDWSVIGAQTSQLYRKLLGT